MLGQQHRLKAALGSRVTIVKTPYFILKFRANDSAYSRFGFVVSKRTAKSAVVRNRTKRIVRAIIEQSLENIKVGYDMVFILTKPLDESLEIKKELFTALTVHKLWQNT